MKPIIIGQAPARGNEGKPPFAGRSGARLAQLAGVGNNGDVLPQHFELYNLIEKYPGKNSRGDKFDMVIARRRARELGEEIFRRGEYNTPILLMGRKVKRAFGVKQDTPYLHWFKFWNHDAVVFPHPSGLNHWWNDHSNELLAADFLRQLLKGVAA